MRVPTQAIHAGLVAVAFLAAPADADPVKVLVWHPLRGGTDNHPAFNPMLRQAMETGAGGPVEFVETVLLTDADLTDVDVAYLWSNSTDASLISPLTASEQATLSDWNNQGGSAFLAFEHFTLGESQLGAAFGLHSAGFSFNWQFANVTSTVNFLTDGPHGQPDSFWTFNAGWFDSTVVSTHWIETAWLDWNGEAVQGYYDWGSFGPTSGIVVANADTSLLDDAGGAFSAPLHDVVSNFFAYVMEGPPDGVPGDIDGDGAVDTADLLVLLSQWGDCPAPPAACAADLDSDGVVSFGDLAMLLLYWE